MIYTSYFAALRRMTPDQKSRCVAISLKVPFPMKRYPQLAPPPDLLSFYKNHKLNIEKYSAIYYNSVLNLLSPDQVAKELDGMILCCYEAPRNFCHRQLVVEWLAENGYEAKELEI